MTTSRFLYYCLNKGRHLSTKVARKRWKPVVGLEIHAQINAKSKLFSGASSSFAGSVNNNVALFDAAIPGTLPVLNKTCVVAGVRTAVALNCRVNEVSYFDRKHYFYADLPSGYQITQQRAPIAEDGEIQFYVFNPSVQKAPYVMKSKLKQIQLEQDSGKTLNDEENRRSLIDLNRAGVGLMELVFEPDLSDGEEAAALVKELTLILTGLDTCSCKMQEGGLRVDANISVEPEGSQQRGVRTEVKNIGSIRGVAKAVNYEIKRQIELLESGYRIVNETRAWDSETSVTVPMRDKEIKQDYRFMPEPNLPPLRLSSLENFSLEGVRSSLPELPEGTRKRLVDSHGLSLPLTFQLVNEPKLLSYFSELMLENPSRPSKTLANLLVMDFMKLVNKGAASLEHDLPKAEHLGNIVDLLHSKEINIQTARCLLEIVSSSDAETPSAIVDENGWKQINDPTELHLICKEALESNPELVKKYKGGKKKVFPSFLGYVARQTSNRANLEKCTQMLQDMLNKD